MAGIPARSPFSALDMRPWQINLAHQLEELRLIQCSLLPGERFAFVLTPEDLVVWTSLLGAFADVGGFDGSDMDVIAELTDPPCQARFEVRVVGVQTWFEVALPRCTDVVPINGSGYYPASSITISVKGEHVSRDAHERWHTEIDARMSEIDEGSPFPAYELLTQLIGTLHQSQDFSFAPATASLPLTDTAAFPESESPQPLYHALLTSHHLISTTKRRTMHHLSSQLGITGFAKVGYPGIIYVEGPQGGVEAFVRDVKAMQWLALRVRFVEPVPNSSPNLDVEETQNARWVEVSKVGEVLELMRVRGREAFITNVGIGVPSKEPGCS